MQMRNLIRRVCGGEGFDWVIEEGMEALKEVLREEYSSINSTWIDESKNNQHGPSMVRGVQVMNDSCFEKDFRAWNVAKKSAKKKK